MPGMQKADICLPISVRIRDEGDNYFVDVYRFIMDIDENDLHLQTEETDGYMFATVDEIKAFAAEGKFLHYDSIKKAFELS